MSKINQEDIVKKLVDDLGLGPTMASILYDEIRLAAQRDRELHPDVYLRVAELVGGHGVSDKVPCGGTCEK